MNTRTAKKLARELAKRVETSYEPCRVTVDVEDDDICVYGNDMGTIHPVEKVVHFAEYHDLSVLLSTVGGKPHLRLF